MKFSRIKSGISLVEVIIVLAISATLFVVVGGVFTFRTRSARDIAARLAASDISKVRNEAQQGLGPTTNEGKAILDQKPGSELFGEAIQFYKGRMTVFKLMKTPEDIVTAYEQYNIPLTQQLQWSIYANEPNSCDNFHTCYETTEGDMGGIGQEPINFPTYQAGSPARLLLVFRNRTGESYIFLRNNYPPGTLGENDFLGDFDGSAKYLNQYTAERQRKFRLAMGIPVDFSAGDPRDDEAYDASFSKSPVKYYIYFDLSIPNDQSLEVVK